MYEALVQISNQTFQFPVFCCPFHRAFHTCALLGLAPFQSWQASPTTYACSRNRQPVVSRHVTSHYLRVGVCVRADIRKKEPSMANPIT